MGLLPLSRNDILPDLPKVGGNFVSSLHLVQLARFICIEGEYESCAFTLFGYEINVSSICLYNLPGYK